MTFKDLIKLMQEVSSPYLLSYNAPDEPLRSYTLELKGKKRTWNVQIFFLEDFPKSLPKAKLLDHDMIGKLAHVSICGTICLEESDSILINHHRPLDVLRYFINNITRLLDRVSLAIYQDELTDEIEGYFNFPNQVYSLYVAEQEVEFLYLRTSKRNGQNKPKDNIPILLQQVTAACNSRFSNIAELNDYQQIKVIHVPLSIPSLPPAEGRNISINYVNELLQNVCARNVKKLHKLLRKLKNGRLFYVLFSMPRSSGIRSQLLIKFHSELPRKHPLLNPSQGWAISEYSLARLSKDYLLERGGAKLDMNSKRVTIVGCGSVGSQVAHLLSKTGIGHLILIDDDNLEADNIYRHQLGGRYLKLDSAKSAGSVANIKKVYALENELSINIPHLNVTPKPTSFLNVIEDPEVKSSDIVVIAVGSPTESMKINKGLKHHLYKNAVFCWNEAAGHGGHSIALNLASNCYECLFTEGDNIAPETTLALLEPGQAISKNLTGCAGVFTPFSYLDSAETAQLAAEQVVRMITSGQSDYALSWKSSKEPTLVTTERFKNMPLKEEINLPLNKDCKLCYEQ